MVEIDKESLHQVLLKVDAALESSIVLVAIGGTALSLLNLKDSTHDIDCIAETDDYLLRIDVIVALDKLGFPAEIQEKGTIVMFTLPDDYLDNAIPYDRNGEFQKLKLFILSPLDILITKLSRYEQKDRIDITVVLLHYRFTWKQIESRFRLFEKLYGGNKEQLKINFDFFREQYDELFPDR